MLKLIVPLALFVLVAILTHALIVHRALFGIGHVTMVSGSHQSIDVRSVSGSPAVIILALLFGIVGFGSTLGRKAFGMQLLIAMRARRQWLMAPFAEPSVTGRGELTAPMGERGIAYAMRNETGAAYDPLIN